MGSHVCRKLFLIVSIIDLVSKSTCVATTATVDYYSAVTTSGRSLTSFRCNTQPCTFIVGSDNRQKYPYNYRRRWQRKTPVPSKSLSRTLCGSSSRIHAGNENSSEFNATHRAAQNDVLQKNSRLSLAPMMEYTDRHFRAMVRLVSGRTLLHTEMVAADDLLMTSNGQTGGRGRRRRVENIKRNIFSPHVQQLLGQSATIPEGPSVLQLGGNDASQLFQAVKTYHQYSQLQLSTASSHSRCEYTALNLNCGCPSPAVSGKKRFGAALMKDPAHVTKLVRAIHDGVDGRLPVTVKCRIGLHDADIKPFSREVYEGTRSSQEEYDELRKFVETVASDGIATDFQIHARIAVLGGTISPADNRKIPPLKYEYVRRLAREFPELNFVMNGGIHSLAQAREELDVDDSLAGVMVGRAFVADPWGFAMADEVLYGDVHDNNHDTHHSVALDQQPRNRREVLQAYGRHADHEERHAEPAQIRRSLVAACAHLFAGEANSKQFRMDLDELAGRPERLEREAKAQAWSSAGGSSLESAFSCAPLVSAGGWDDMQAVDDARPSWDEDELPLSELVMDAACRHFGDEVLDRSRRESYEKKIWEEDEARRRRANGDPVLFVGGDSGKIDNGEKVSGGVVDGWFSKGLN